MIFLSGQMLVAGDSSRCRSSCEQSGAGSQPAASLGRGGWDGRAAGIAPLPRGRCMCPGGSGAGVASASHASGAHGQGQRFPGLCLGSSPLQSWGLAGKRGGCLFSGLGIKAGHCCDGGRGWRRTIACLGCVDAGGEAQPPKTGSIPMPMGRVGHRCAELYLSSAAAFPLTGAGLLPATLPVLAPEEKKKHIPPLNELSINRLCQILVLTS